MVKKKTQEEFIKEIEDKYHGEYSVLSKYINAKTKILVRHNCHKCDSYEYEVTPNNLLRGKGCPKCAGNIKKLRKILKKKYKKSM